MSEQTQRESLFSTPFFKQNPHARTMRVFWIKPENKDLSHRVCIGKKDLKNIEI